jgi:hypothetical protein
MANIIIKRDIVFEDHNSDGYIIKKVTVTYQSTADIVSVDIEDNGSIYLMKDDWSKIFEMINESIERKGWKL